MAAVAASSLASSPCGRHQQFDDKPAVIRSDLEHRSETDELAKDAADGPDIYTGGVMACTHKKIGRSVPDGDDDFIGSV